MVDDRLDDQHDGCPSYWYVNQKLMQSGPEVHTFADRWGDLRGRCIYPNEKRRVYLNRGAEVSPRFIDVAESVGLTEGENSRGVALADFDNDGALDVLITNQHASPTLLRNVATHGHDWVGIDLRGTTAACPRSALGSRVTVQRQGERPIVRELHAANGFSSQNDHRVHVGLGPDAPAIVDVAVEWCGGPPQQYQLPTGRYQVLMQ